MDEFYINQLMAPLLQQAGGSYGFLQQSSMYNSRNPGMNIPQGPTGPSQINTLPAMHGNTPMAMIYNMAAGMGDQFIQQYAHNRGRIATPISTVPINMLDVMNARNKMAFMGQASEIGGGLDSARGNAAYANLQQNTGSNIIGNGAMGGGIGSFLAGQGLQALQGGTFSGYAETAARSANYFQPGSSLQQVQALTNAVQNVGFSDGDGNIGINHSFTRGLGLGQIGQVTQAMMQRGMLNMGANNEGALAAQYYSGKPEDLSRRLRALNDTISVNDKHIADSSLGDPMTASDLESVLSERNALQSISALSPMDRVRAAKRLKDSTVSALITDRGFSSEKATSMYEQLRSANENRVSGQEAMVSNASEFLGGGPDEKSVKDVMGQLQSGKMMKQMGDFIKMVSSVGDMFEQSSGDVNGILRIIDSVDSRALNQVSSSQLAASFTESKYAAQAAGLSSSQGFSVMQGAARQAQGYGASVQEGQLAANMGMVAGANYRNEFSSPGTFGNISEGEFRKSQIDRSIRASRSEAGGHIAMFMSGFEQREAAGQTVTDEERQMAAAIREEDTDAFHRLSGGDSYNLTKYGSYADSTTDGANRWSANNAGTKLGITGALNNKFDSDRVSDRAGNFLLNRKTTKASASSVFAKAYTSFLSNTEGFYNPKNLGSSPEAKAAAKEVIERGTTEFSELMNLSRNDKGAYEAAKADKLDFAKDDVLETRRLNRKFDAIEKASDTDGSLSDYGSDFKYNAQVSMKQGVQQTASESGTTVTGVMANGANAGSRRGALSMARVKEQSDLSEGLKAAGFSSTIFSRMANSIFGENNTGSFSETALDVLMPAKMSTYSKTVQDLTTKAQAAVTAKGGSAAQQATDVANILQGRSEAVSSDLKEIAEAAGKNKEIQGALKSVKDEELNKDDMSILAAVKGKNLKRSEIMKLQEKLAGGGKDLGRERLAMSDQVIRDLDGDYSSENLEAVLKDKDYNLDKDTRAAVGDRVTQAGETKKSFTEALSAINDIHSGKTGVKGRQKAIESIRRKTGASREQIDSVIDTAEKGKDISLDSLFDATQATKGEGGTTSSGDSAPENGGRVLGSGDFSKGGQQMSLSGTLKLVSHDGAALELEDVKVLMGK